MTVGKVAKVGKAGKVSTWRRNWAPDTKVEKMGKVANFVVLSTFAAFSNLPDAGTSLLSFLFQILMFFAQPPHQP